jgi:hypothetical protein
MKLWFPTEVERQRTRRFETRGIRSTQIAARPHHASFLIFVRDDDASEDRTPIVIDRNRRVERT